MGRPPIGSKAMSGAERQRDYIARLKAAADGTNPRIRKLEAEVKRLKKELADHTVSDDSREDEIDVDHLVINLRTAAPAAVAKAIHLANLSRRLPTFGSSVRQHLAKQQLAAGNFKGVPKGSLDKLKQAIRPYLDGLKIEGKASMATMAPMQVAMLTEQIERVLDAWEIELV